MTKTGVYWTEDNADATPIRLCGPIEILASTRDSRSMAWGLLLRWYDDDGVAHEWAMPRKLLDGDGMEIRRKLLDEGLFVAAGQKARNKLAEFFLSVKVEARARCLVLSRALLVAHRNLGMTSISLHRTWSVYPMFSGCGTV